MGSTRLKREAVVQLIFQRTTSSQEDGREYCLQGEEKREENPASNAFPSREQLSGFRI